MGVDGDGVVDVEVVVLEVVIVVNCCDYVDDKFGFFGRLKILVFSMVCDGSVDICFKDVDVVWLVEDCFVLGIGCV